MPEPDQWTRHAYEKETRTGFMVLDRYACDWVIDDERDTAICRTHGEVCDGPKSPHFPGRNLKHEPPSG